MRRIHLWLLAFSPVLIGYLFNLTALIPGFFIMLSYLMPIAMIVYWFWVGRKFAAFHQTPFMAILLGNIFGIISVGVYYWQFVLLTNQARTFVLAAFSQQFTSPLIMITVRIGRLFEAAPDTVTQTTLNASQAIGLLLMLIVFSAGYHRKKA